mmetsp:Transcript_1459/g.3698  ORF Transcript_1459/g.3698 Transcript_1459/m.3698 type:complete len:1141 (+) Transcript_1459:269-3691(+)
MMTSNFQTRGDIATAVDVDTNFQDGPNFDNRSAADGSSAHANSSNDPSSHQDNNDDDCDDGRSLNGDDSHFGDIAQAAARAMEDVDMDRLCGELFAQEMLTQEMLEGAGVVAAQDAVAATTQTTAAEIDASNSSNNGTASPSKSRAGNIVTDCASSTATDGSDSTIPSTIAVPSQRSPEPRRRPPVASCYALPPQGHQAMGAASNFSTVDGAQQAFKRQRTGHGTIGAATFPPQQPPPPQAAAALVTTMTTTTGQGIPPRKVQDEGEIACARCGFPGADVRIRCTRGCAYHARCLDLSAVCQKAPSPPGNNNNPPPSTGDDDVRVTSCPCCRAPSSGIQILPLSFSEMDRVQRSARAAFAAGCTAVVPGNNGNNGNGKRPHDPIVALNQVLLPTTIPSHAGAQPRRTVQCYDPSKPRTGRWTDEEIAFRDTLISHFLDGSLPLGNGLKLNDFLPVMLKSKQSRLAKKMKHAKLSTKYFYPKGGCAPTDDAAIELSRLERDFVSSIPDPVERSEVRFHMGREWREHLASRLSSLSIVFEGRAWLGSVEDMERRLAFEKERHRLAKRRFMMGKAMEKDSSEMERGVFVDDSPQSRGKEEFELVVEKSVSNSAGANRGRRDDASSSPGIVGFSGPRNSGGETAGMWTSNEPNFKHAAPFLAGIASYIERNGVPFEHVDVWVPSYVEDGASTRGSRSVSPPNSPGRVSPDAGNFRLCFGGSVTMGVQITHDPSDAAVNNAQPRGNPAVSRSPSPSSALASMKRLPLAPEDKTNFSLFGDYSHKFSFSSGCGLPGRIFKSGVPAWEQFVSRAHPSLFERRGGAVQFGVKTAVGLPVDSPNVGRIVLVMYSKHDRARDEGLVGRMLADLKLLNPSPRWKLVVDVDTPGGMMGGSSSASSLQAPPPEAANVHGGGGPAVLSRGNSTGSGPCQVDNAAAAAVNPAGNDKESQIRSLILLLASNIPSDMNSPLGQQLQGIMSLRLVLLRGNRRTPEEEQLVETILVLYESYIHAGRSEADIAVMVARDFTFHLGHLGGLAMRYGTAQVPQSQAAPRGLTYPGPVAAMGQAPVPAPLMMGNCNMGSSPLMGPNYNNVPPQVHNPSPPMTFTTNYQQQQQQQQPMSQNMSFLSRQNSASSFAGSPRSSVSR